MFATIFCPKFIGFGKIVEVLMQNGANAKLANKNGKTAIDIAYEKGMSFCLIII